MNDFSVPAIKNQFGLPASPANHMQPFKRAVTSMSPIIVTDESGSVKVVIGSAGGTKIPTAIALVIF